MLRLVRMATFLFALAAAPAMAATSAPTISSINGYSDGFTVSNGRFVGQIVAVPKGGTNRYKNFLASDSYNFGSLAANPYYWDINGSNFGNAVGTVSLGVTPNPFTSITIVCWAPTKIRVKVVATPDFVSSAIAVTVTTSTRQSSAPFHDNVAGTIKGRGAGQCTWYAAQQRIDHNLSIPPTPWGTNGSISAVGTAENGYKPQQWDCIIYAGHIAIISSAPVQTINSDGSMKWTFVLSEYNAAWNESLSTSVRTYGLSKPDSRGKRTVTVGIGTNLNNSTATGYYR